MKVVIVVLALAGVGLMAVDLRSPYDKAADSTVWLEAGEGSGTGVFVGPNLILTAFHVVEGETRILAHAPHRKGGVVVSDPEDYQQGMNCIILASDPERDLALLRVEGRGQPMGLARSEPSPGDRLVAVGCGDGTSLFGFNSGYLRQSYNAEIPRPRRMFRGRVMDLSVTTNFGDSGSGVVNSSGELVGIISQMDASKNETYLAVSLSAIRKFLEGVER